MVDSTNLPEVDINAIATDLNNKADRDLVNLSDTGNIQMAKASMPSNKYINLTLNASNSTYTAPADGYFFLNKTTGANSGSLAITNNSLAIRDEVHISNVGNGTWVCGIVPARKGDTVKVEYSLAGVTNYFRFIYAVGSESEAN